MNEQVGGLGPEHGAAAGIGDGEIMRDRIDIDCDMGESYGAYRLGRNSEVIEYISSAIIACGWHAGDPLVTDYTVRVAKEKGAGVGAHPAYPDLLGFGRRRMNLTSDEIEKYVIYQIGALYGSMVLGLRPDSL
jgi:UPF0271 protein